MSAIFQSGRMRSRQKGLALVEFALVMPLVAYLMFAAAEIGRGFYQFNALNKTVRDGARYLADQAVGTSGVPVITPADAAIAANLVVFGNPAGTGDPLLPGLSTADVSSTIVSTRYFQVTAAYDFQAVFVPLPDFGYGDGQGITIGPFTASTTQRSLR